MLSSQIIQTSIDELKAITKVDLCVFDLGGILLAKTTDMSDVSAAMLEGFIASPADGQVIGSYHLLKVWDEGEVLYVVVAKGTTDDAYLVGKIAVCQLQNLSIAYKEKFDRNNFFQNLLLDNLLLVDIYNRAKKLHIDVNAKRVVFILETNQSKDYNLLETIKGMFHGRNGDFIFLQHPSTEGNGKGNGISLSLLQINRALFCKMIYHIHVTQGFVFNLCFPPTDDLILLS
jgi:carbohydrate diacid regulator